MGVERRGDSLLKELDKVLMPLEPRKFISRYMQPLFDAIVANIAQRFTANKVGGSWSGGFPPSIFEQTDPTTGQKLFREDLYKSYTQLFENLRSERSVSMDAPSAGGQGETYKDRFDNNAADYMNITGDSGLRPASSDFESNVLDTIKSEPDNITYNRSHNKVVYSLAFGSISHLMSNTALPPPMQEEKLVASGEWTPENLRGYFAALIQEFGTATHSTAFRNEAAQSFLNGVKHMKYLWIVHYRLPNGFHMPMYHPGRRGRHMYVDESGNIYQEDSKGTVLHILQDYFNRK